MKSKKFIIGIAVCVCLLIAVLCLFIPNQDKRERDAACCGDS